MFLFSTAELSIVAQAEFFTRSREGGGHTPENVFQNGGNLKNGDSDQGIQSS